MAAGLTPSEPGAATAQHTSTSSYSVVMQWMFVDPFLGVADWSSKTGNLPHGNSRMDKAWKITYFPLLDSANGSCACFFPPELVETLAHRNLSPNARGAPCDQRRGPGPRPL